MELVKSVTRLTRHIPLRRVSPGSGSGDILSFGSVSRHDTCNTQSVRSNILNVLQIPANRTNHLSGH